MEQLSLLFIDDKENAEELKRQVELFAQYAKDKRNWENAFQKWSNDHGIDGDGTEDYGCCGYGSMCDWCEDNSYGRPCVRSLNAMCREKHLAVDYSQRDFVAIWRGNKSAYWGNNNA